MKKLEQQLQLTVNNSKSEKGKLIIRIKQTLLKAMRVCVIKSGFL